MYCNTVYLQCMNGSFNFSCLCLHVVSDSFSEEEVEEKSGSVYAELCSNLDYKVWNIVVFRFFFDSNNVLIRAVFDWLWFTQLCWYSQTYAHAHACIPTYPSAHTCMQAYTCRRTHNIMLVCTCVHTHMRAHTCAHTCTHTLIKGHCPPHLPL